MQLQMLKSVFLQGRHVRKSETDAVAINYALSACDHVIYTGVSTYGHIAIARGAWNRDTTVAELSLEPNIKNRNLTQVLLHPRFTVEPPCFFWEKANSLPCFEESPDKHWTTLPGWLAE